MCAIPYLGSARKNIKKGSREVSLFYHPVIRDDSVLIQLEDGHEGTLRDFDCADLAHALLSLLLLLEEFSLTRDVTSVTLRSNVLSHSLHSLAGDDLRSDCGLDRDIELLPWDEFLELLAHLASEVICMVCMDQRRKRIGWVTIEEDVELHELRFLESDHMVVE